MPIGLLLMGLAQLTTSGFGSQIEAPMSTNIRFIRLVNLLTVSQQEHRLSVTTVQDMVEKRGLGGSSVMLLADALLLFCSLRNCFQL